MNEGPPETNLHQWGDSNRETVRRNIELARELLDYALEALSVNRIDKVSASASRALKSVETIRDRADRILEGEEEPDL